MFLFRVIYSVGCLSLVLVLTACTQQNASTPQVDNPTLMITPNPVQATNGNASVIGRLLDPQQNPLANTTVQLAEVYRQGDDGGFVLNAGQSPRTETDAEGNFTFQNVPAREYVIVVGNVENTYKLITADDQKPRVVNAPANDVLQLNEIIIDLNSP